MTRKERVKLEKADLAYRRDAYSCYPANATLQRIKWLLVQRSSRLVRVVTLLPPPTHLLPTSRMHHTPLKAYVQLNQSRNVVKMLLEL